MNVTTQSTRLNVRIDTATKERAASALADMGLSVSDAVRLLLMRIAEERRLPFEVKVPNKATREAIAELEAGKGVRYNSIADMIAGDAASFAHIARIAGEAVLGD